MTDNYKKALDLINKLANLVSDLQKFEDYGNRVSYVYVDTGGGYFELELDYLTLPPHSLKTRLLSGEDLSPENIVDAFLSNTPKYSHVPSEYTDEDIANLVEGVRENYWYKYNKVQGQAKLVKEQLETINEEAGYTVVNVDLVASLLKSSEEFYESSRCW